MNELIKLDLSIKCSISGRGLFETASIFLRIISIYFDYNPHKTILQAKKIQRYE